MPKRPAGGSRTTPPRPQRSLLQPDRPERASMASQRFPQRRANPGAMRPSGRQRSIDAAGNGITCAACSGPGCSPCGTGPKASAAAWRSAPTAAGLPRCKAAIHPTKKARPAKSASGTPRAAKWSMPGPWRHLRSPGLSSRRQTRLALAGTDGTVVIWDTESRKELVAISGA